MVSIEEVLVKWQSKKRHMGCVSATNWFCKRVKGFYPERLIKYTKQGEVYQHVVATNGIVRIDLAPYSDKAKE
jgi:hypothetical protein